MIETSSNMNCDNTPMFDGDAEALFSVGRRFLTGNGVEKDETKGLQIVYAITKENR